MMEPAGWEVLREEVLLDSPHLRVVEEHVRTPSSEDGRTWIRATRKVGVTVAPRLLDGSFVLIREERVPARRDFWQFPAGQVDGESSPEACEEAARRELVEESGCVVQGRLEYLGCFYTSPGFTDEHAHQFLATDVGWDRGIVAHECEEKILEIKAFSAEELRRMVADRIIEDANTLGVYARLAAGGYLR
ncbi:MAG: NUDIX hydrolase [Chthoniobacterales bacterium]